MHNSGPYTPVSMKGTTVFMPGTSGGGNWGGVSTDPRNDYFFVNISNRPTTSRMVADGAGGYKLEGAYNAFSDDKGWPCINPPWGELIAVSARSGEIVWRSPLGSADVYGERGKASGTTTLGGSFATAGGLIFIGATVDSKFRAFDAANGKEVWSTQLPSPAMATPIVYRGKSGREIVAIAAGGPGTVQVPGHFASYHQVLIGYALPKAGEQPVNLAMFAPTEMPQRRGPANVPTTTTSPLPGTLAAGQPELPDGVGKQEFVTMCGQCHGVSTALAARRSPKGWHDLIQDMRARGAQGDDATANRVNEYLSRNFGVVP
jgi:quinoprotein glucose dehydrogenase